MNIYRKNILIQLLMFIVFFIMGLNTILQHYLLDTFSAYTFIVLGVLILFGIFGYLLYKRSDDRILVISQKQLKMIRTILYIYLFTYIAEMVLSGIDNISVDIVKLIFGIALMMISCVGIYLNIKLLKTKK